jgi:hypothetical protein
MAAYIKHLWTRPCWTIGLAYTNSIFRGKSKVQSYLFFLNTQGN